MTCFAKNRNEVVFREMFLILKLLVRFVFNEIQKCHDVTVALFKNFEVFVAERETKFLIFYVVAIANYIILYSHRV